MIRGLYTATAGMLAQQQRQNILSTNLSNVETPGYKAKQGVVRSFPEMLIHAIRLENGKANPIGSLHQGAFVEENIPLFSQGDIVDTGVNSHMAILDSQLEVNPDTGKKSSLFFTLEDANGDRLYTRSGLFTEDAAGQLVTPEGYLVLDDYGFPIQPNGREYAMNDDGTISFADGEEVKVGLTVIENPLLLENKGNQMFTFTGNTDELAYADEGLTYKVYQGKIERANVDTAQTMVDMMSALRLYEANQKVIQSIDQTLQKAVTEIGRV